MNVERAYTAREFALINKHRDINVDHDWWCFTYDRFIEQTNAIGIGVIRDDIQFSGFWSQGDGASFTFRSWSLATMLEKCMEHIERHEALTEDHRKARMEGAVYKAALDFAYEVRKVFAKFVLLGELYTNEILGGICVTAERISNSYSHARTVRAEWDSSDADRSEYSDLIEESGLRLALRELDIDEAIEHLADALYKDLEAEYTYQTDDHQVWAAIEANDLEEDEESEEDECEPA